MNMETIEVYGTETLEETDTETGAVVLVDADQTVQILEQIAFDLRVVLLFTVLAFVMSAMRAWRKRTIGDFK